MIRRHPSRPVRRAKWLARISLALGLSFGGGTILFGQEPPPTDAPPARTTLPPLEVRPEPESSASAALDDAEFGPGLFPSLGEQMFGGSALDLAGLNGALRGTRSVFDDSHLDTIVDRETIREKGATDMFQALQYEVGVLMQSTGRGQASPFLRGVTGQQVLVLVDGIRLNNAVLRAGPNQYFNTIDPGQVDRIEVVRGAGSVLYGSDAIGGVINIVTRGADPLRGDYLGNSFRSTFSTADSGWYGRGNVEGWVGSTGLFAGASYMNIHDVDIGGGLGRQPFTNYDQYAGDIKFNQMIGDNQMLTVALSHFEQQDVPRSDRFPPFVLGPPANTARPTYFDPQQRNMAWIRWQGLAEELNPLYDVFSATFSYSLTNEGQRERRSATQLDVGKFRDDMVGVTVALNKELGDFGKVTYGVDYYYEDIDAARQRFNPANPNQPPTTRPPQYPDDSIADQLGTYVQWDAPITERLNALVGTRYTNANLSATPLFTINNVPQNVFFERTYQDWVANAGLTYDLGGCFKLVGGFSEGYRSPTIDDLTANNTFQQNSQSNPTLGSLGVQPEHSYTYEAGLKFDGDILRFQVYEWWMRIDDYIARSIDGANNVFLGNHEASLNGTEFAGELLVTETWSLYGNFAYTYGEDLTDQTFFSRIPPMQSTVGVRWRDLDRRSYLDVFTWMVDRQDRYNPTNVTDSRFPVGGNPGYATLNVRCGTRLGECDQHRLSLVVENITDKYYRVLGSGVNGTGFNAIFGYELVR